MVWIVIGVLRGAMGVTSKLKEPLKCSQVDMSGAMLDWRRRFRVRSVCGRSLYHRKLGNVLDTLARIERKCALKVWIIFLDALRPCVSGGTSWGVAFNFSSIWIFYALLHSLSSTCRSKMCLFFLG